MSITADKHTITITINHIPSDDAWQQVYTQYKRKKAAKWLVRSTSTPIHTSTASSIR